VYLRNASGIQQMSFARGKFHAKRLLGKEEAAMKLVAFLVLLHAHQQHDGGNQ
jgi:hypothetical protein